MLAVTAGCAGRACRCESSPCMCMHMPRTPGTQRWSLCLADRTPLLGAVVCWVRAACAQKGGSSAETAAGVLPGTMAAPEGAAAAAGRVMDHLIAESVMMGGRHVLYTCGHASAERWRGVQQCVLNLGCAVWSIMRLRVARSGPPEPGWGPRQASMSSKMCALPATLECLRCAGRTCTNTCAAMQRCLAGSTAAL
jgi:hypothetical protein